MSVQQLRFNRWGLLVVLALVAAACAAPAPPANSGVAEASYAGDTEAGLLLYNEHCLECHSATLPSAFVGPSLYQAGDRLTADYIKTSVRDPHSAVAPEYTGGTPMPTDLMDRLTDQDLANIVAYLLAGAP